MRSFSTRSVAPIQPGESTMNPARRTDRQTDRRTHRSVAECPPTAGKGRIMDYFAKRRWQLHKMHRKCVRPYLFILSLKRESESKEAASWEILPHSEILRFS